MNKYELDFLDNVSKLDTLVGAYGKILKYANSIIEENDDKSTITLLKIISDLLESENCKKEIKSLSILIKQNLINYYGYLKITEICNYEKIEDDNITLAQLMNELNKLIGLKKVKQLVNDLIIYQKVQKMRNEENLYSNKNTLHLAFTGNPGTGKTTVARIIGRIYKQLGILSKGHFIEVSRTDLIAGYQGQTAIKVKKVIERAKGGVLFIDEAYSITENEHSDSYGRECLTEITKALEDYRDDLVVIVAGYTEPMEKFFESNPGLKSRFNTFIEFDDYNVDELLDILMLICNDNNYELDCDLKNVIKEFLNNKINNKDVNFSNARMVRNIYDKLVMSHAKRVIKINNITSEELKLIKEEDFSIIR